MGMIGNAPYQGLVAAGNLAPGAVVGHLGFTPVNKAGDTMSGQLNLTGAIEVQGDGTSNGYKNINLKNGTKFWHLSGPRDDGGGLAAGNFGLWYNDGTWKGPYLQVDTAGRITQPNLPAFSQAGGGYSTSRNSGIASAALGDSVNTILNVAGSGFNTTNGQFTAPVAGLYEFTANACLANTAGDVGLAIRRNSVDIAYQLLYRLVYNGNSAHAKAYLSQGDVITAVIVWNNSSYSTIYSSQFSGQLIG